MIPVEQSRGTASNSFERKKKGKKVPSDVKFFPIIGPVRSQIGDKREKIYHEGQSDGRDKIAVSKITRLISRQTGEEALDVEHEITRCL